MIEHGPARSHARGALVALVLMIAGAPVARAGVLPAADIAGPWLTPKRDSIVNFQPCGPGWCAYIAKVLRPAPGAPTTDVRNPDPAMRGRPIEGLQLMRLDRFEGTSWRGTVYDPRSGHSYRVYVRRGAQSTLEVKGCFAFICETQRWTLP